MKIAAPIAPHNVTKNEMCFTCGAKTIRLTFTTTDTANILMPSNRRPRKNELSTLSYSPSPMKPIMQPRTPTAMVKQPKQAMSNTTNHGLLSVMPIRL